MKKITANIKDMNFNNVKVQGYEVKIVPNLRFFVHRKYKGRYGFSTTMWTLTEHSTGVCVSECDAPTIKEVIQRAQTLVVPKIEDITSAIEFCIQRHGKANE